MKHSRVIIVAVIVMFLFINTRYYTTFPKEITILQIDSPSSFSTDLLLEKQPMMFNIGARRHHTPHKFLSRMLRYLYIHSTTEYVPAVATGAVTNHNAFLAIHVIDDFDQLVSIAAPVYARENMRSIDGTLKGGYIDVRMKPGSVLLLPFMWTYHCSTEHMRYRFIDFSHTLADHVIQWKHSLFK